MKACRVCGRLYPDEAGFCPVEGALLHSATQVPVQADDGDPRVGQLICSRYQIRRVVADGGMGRVYEALDMYERRSVALKILHAEIAHDEVSVERFKREYDVSCQLPHTYIVEVTDFQATTDDSYVLAMEFLYGEELRSTLQREKILKPARVIRMMSQTALGLGEAHARKFVHRDLKPDNLFLCQTSAGDIVKLLDFGSVKDKGETAKKLTVMGTTIGSPFYMAPEQAQGLDTLDHRADVWAMAAIVYEMLTGRVPFYGTNGPSILLEILTKEPVPPSQVECKQEHPLPPTLDRAISNALKKTAAVRTASIGAFADALGQAFGLSGTHAEWAEIPESELDTLIAAKRNEMAVVLPPTSGADAGVDDFFGEDDSLGAMDDAFAAVEAPSGARAPTAPMSATQDALPMGSRPNWVLPAIVAVVMLLVGMAIVVILG
ncbi:MAG: serine/threonine protein kinase [Polyangiaceae bacterium]|nr:serine/threonine protein kinase [Polyangiaceae bacterium]